MRTDRRSGHEREQEHPLILSERRFRSLIENSSDLITILDGDHVVRYESPSAGRILGYDGGDRIGRSILDFVHALDLGEVLHVLGRALASPGANLRVEFRCLHRDGGWRILDATVRNLLDDAAVAGMVVNAREITERKRAEEARQRLAAVMDATPDLVSTLDPHGRVNYINRAGRRLLGLAANAEVTRLNITDLHPAWANALVMDEGLPAAVRDGVWSGESALRNDAGQEIPVLQVILAHTDTDGAVQFFSTTARDISDRKRVEAELQRAHRLEAIGQLAGGIAHEVNTPMQYIVDNVRFLREGLDSLLQLVNRFETALDADASDARRTLASLQAELDVAFIAEGASDAAADALDGLARISHIVKAMKDFAQPAVSEKVATDLNQAILDTATVASSEWRHVAALETDLDPALPLVPCLPGDLNQTLLGLLLNAAEAIVEAGRGGSGGIIRISTRASDDFVEVRIADNGVGIPEAVRPRLFDAFFTTKDVGRGTGYGLTQAYATVVQKHGGTIVFETEPDVGTTFILRLPIPHGARTPHG